MKFDLPHDIECEKSIIGCALLDPTCLPDLRHILRPQDFYLELHRDVWVAILACQDGGQGVGVLQVRAMLQAKSGDQLAYLNECISQVPSSSQAEFYATRVVACSRSRAYMIAAQRVMEKAGKMADLDALRAEFEATVDEASSCGNLSITAKEAGELALATFDGGKRKRFDTGIQGLTDATGGLYTGLNVISGIPGAGKTTLAIQLLNRAMRSGHKVFIVSIDQCVGDFTAIMWQNWTGLPVDDLMRGPDWDKPFRELTGQAFEFYKGPSKLPNIAAAIRLHATRGYDWCVLDYLGLIQVPRSNSPHEASETAAKAVKALAHEYDLTVILLVSYVKPPPGTRESTDMSSMRGTYEIAHAAEQIWVLEQGKLETGEPTKVHIRKSRHAGKSCVLLDYDGRRRRFTDPSGTGLSHRLWPGKST